VARVEGIERAASELRGLALAGAAYRGVGVPDCVHSGELAAEAIIAHLAAHPAHPAHPAAHPAAHRAGG
jgi:protoporphyrinogen/coproporphyrinogen III oxidase